MRLLYVIMRTWICILEVVHDTLFNKCQTCKDNSIYERLRERKKR